MNDKDIARDHDEMDDRLMQFQLSRPAEGHRQRVLDASRADWPETRLALKSPRSIGPILRFAAAIAASVLIVVLAEASADRTLARWADPERSAMAAPATTPLADLSGLENHRFAGGLVGVPRSPVRRDSAIDLAAHHRQLRELLEELAKESRTRSVPRPDRKRGASRSQSPGSLVS